MNLQQYRNISIYESRYTRDYIQTMQFSDLVLKKIKDNVYEVVKDRYDKPGRQITLSDDQLAKMLLLAR